MELRDVAIVALAVAYPLAWIYLQERIKNVAREQTDRALAALRHEHDQRLAALQADHQRRVQEFGLFATERHRVYAQLFRRVRASSDSIAGLWRFGQYPDFKAFGREELLDYARHHKLRKSILGGARGPRC